MDKIGKYTIQGEIGKGGMGIVYRAVDPYIGRTVAIKTIRLDLLRQESGRDEALKRFLREAQAAGNLSHPNIVTIYDVGEHEGLIYIAMEHIDGRSLEDLLLQGRKFALEEIVRLVGQVAPALDYAHGKGIVHRDIKPANILVGPDLKVSIVDFGIARTSASTMTQTGTLMGTPRYMSPEQIAGRKVDSRADIFSLGAILYELLTQRNPFEGESITTVIYKIMHADLPPLSDFNKQLPAGLEQVVSKALARDADSRYATCGELLAGLQACLPVGGRQDTLREPGRELERTQLLPPGEKTMSRSPARRGKRWLLALAALVVMLAAAMAVMRFTARKDAAPVAAADKPAPVAVPPQAGTPDVQDEPAAGEEAPPEAAPAARQATLSPVPGTAKSADAKTAPATVTPAPAEAAEEEAVAPARTNRQGAQEQVFFNDTVMVKVPAGEFTIGSPAGEGDDDEHPAHKVFISGFWLGKTEVTFAQYDEFCLQTGRSLAADAGWGRLQRPVIHVSWEDADAYCRWLSQKTGRRFRLPSEAEWEKAARGKYPWGRSAPTANHANMKGSKDGYAATAPVGSFPAGASPYGILDLAGNVWEWMADFYDPGFYRASPDRDPRSPASGTSRSVRGGSWANGSELIRSANRSSESPVSRLNILGFRVAMDDR
ncbi:MAG: bifunctional serine/threonine-protein kinase/formylglycine-generating enzyme family protein [Acidobacteria bacterium]|jgi:serine/threonine-protein kinase|nr:bifunctional serine/threonine-protein kinase/formylglycine-generating enzyme family protein [Acidobacteriota bacterium]